MIENNIRLSILKIPRIFKRAIVMIIDGLLSIFAVWIAYYLRTGEIFIIWEKYNEHYAIPAFIAAITISIPIFTTFRLYKTIFRYSGSQAIVRVVKAFTIYSTIYV